MRLSRRLRIAQIHVRAVDGSHPLAVHRPGNSVLLTAGGAVAASLGGVLLLGFALALATGELATAEIAPMIANGILMGLTPLAGGVAIFAWGLKRLVEGGVVRRG